MSVNAKKVNVSPNLDKDRPVIIQKKLRWITEAMPYDSHPS